MGTENLKENGELRFLARQRLKGNWGIPILVCFLVSIIVGTPGAIPAIGWIIAIVITGPLMLGQAKYFIRMSRGENPPLEMMFDGFKLFTPSMLLQVLTTLFVLLWSLLLIVPGIIAAFRYSMAFYILNDNPQMKAMDALNLSKQMMVGYKGKLFMLYLSFFGWALLSILTLGIGFLWLNPYIQLTMANFYEDLRISNGYVVMNPYPDNNNVM